MKKIFIPFLLIFLMPAIFSCRSAKLGYMLNERDAANAIRELLSLGTTNGSVASAFSKERILTTVFPEGVAKALRTLDQLGLTSEVDRFTNTLSTAAEKTAERSIPIFVGGIRSMRLTDAMRIVKNGGSSATDYFRANVGDSVRRAITPVMQAALDEYKVGEQWKKISGPIQSILGNKINIDLATITAGMVSEAMFRKMAEKEIEVRTRAEARSTPLLQKVFSRDWN